MWSHPTGTNTGYLSFSFTSLKSRTHSSNSLTYKYSSFSVSRKSTGVQYPVKIFNQYCNESNGHLISFLLCTTNFLNKSSLSTISSCPPFTCPHPPSSTQKFLVGILYKNFLLEGHLLICNCKIIESNNFRAGSSLWYLFPFSHFTDEEGHMHTFTRPVVSFVLISPAALDVVDFSLFSEHRLKYINYCQWSPLLIGSNRRPKKLLRTSYISHETRWLSCVFVSIQILGWDPYRRDLPFSDHPVSIYFQALFIIIKGLCYCWKKSI